MTLCCCVLCFLLVSILVGCWFVGVVIAWLKYCFEWMFYFVCCLMLIWYLCLFCCLPCFYCFTCLCYELNWFLIWFSLLDFACYCKRVACWFICYWLCMLVFLVVLFGVCVFVLFTILLFAVSFVFCFWWSIAIDCILDW